MRSCSFVSLDSGSGTRGLKLAAYDSVARLSFGHPFSGVFVGSATNAYSMAEVLATCGQG